MTDDREVVIVVPVYRETLTATEQVSLAQLVRVLGRYDICFIAPRSFAGRYIDTVPRGRVLLLPNEYFTSKASYSRLLLTADFYRQFTEYRYILIYQLDAFVFSDRLAEFCAMGYDYIAAPVPRYSANWRDIGTNIGVGGLSLRRVASAIRLLEQRDAILAALPDKLRQTIYSWEDLFFAYASTRGDLDYHVPSFQVALDFALSADVAHAYEQMPRWLPFGCHAFDVVDYWHYQPIINGYGYNLPEPVGAKCMPTRRARVARYMVERLLRAENNNAAERVRTRLLTHIGAKKVAIWGCGAYGLPLARLLAPRLHCIYDRNAEQRLNGVEQLPPEHKHLAQERFPIIVGALNRENELCAMLSRLGKIAGKDYFRISELLQLITEPRDKL